MAAGSISNLALVAVALEQPERALRLFSIGERVRQELGAPLQADDQTLFDVQLDELRLALGSDERYRAVWEEGQAMDWDSAVRYSIDS